MIALDNTFLTLMLHPSARPPLDPSTGNPVDHLEERIELLIETWDKDRETIIIPTPVLSEFLILAGNDGTRYLTEIDKKNNFHIEAFDTRAAVELATVELAMRASRGKNADKKEGVQGTWAKIKFDRQIVAIAKVNGATRIYSDDQGVETFAKRCGIHTVKTWELLLPPEKHPLLRAAEQAAGELLGGQSVESEGKDEERTPDGNGKERFSTFVKRVSGVQEPSASPSLSPEEGSGEAGSEAREE